QRRPARPRAVFLIRRGGGPVTDLVALTAELIGIPSVSHHEEGITDWLEGHLRDTAWLDVTRVGNNLVARTDLGRAQRLLIAGHTDTVPANGNEVPRIEGDVEI